LKNIFAEDALSSTFKLGEASMQTSMAPGSSTAAGAAASPAFAELHTYFLFPFALDKHAIREDHPEAWPGKTRWIDGLDSWIAGHSGRQVSQSLAGLGPWSRSSYSKFDVDSPAYSDLLFFHSIIRHVFFDTIKGRHPDDQENQLRCYTIDVGAPSRLWFEGSDALGGGARAQVTDLRLYLSAQGMGILSVGVATGALPAEQALWVNHRLRKLYPPDADSLRQGRTPNWLALRVDRGSRLETICEERFEHPAMVGFYPPLANTVQSLLYFADYCQEEYEPVLDENMLVYSCGLLDTGGVPVATFDAAVDDFLYLGHKHAEATVRLSGGATTLFGFTAHSLSILQLGPEAREPDASGQRRSGGGRGPQEPELLGVFHTRYYLMSVIALFYRAVLLDFHERGALVSRRLLQDEQSGRLTLPSINMVNELRTEFLHFSSYWHFDDISCKETDNDLFRRLCSEYKIASMKGVLADELRHMAEFVYNFYQLKNTEAVNRLAILSLIFGGGAVLTGFFGMNFGREFGRFFFEGESAGSFGHYFMVTLVCAFVFVSLALGTFVVLRNWREYLAILSPSRKRSSPGSLKRNG
jgi:hypothetical protein